MMKTRNRVRLASVAAISSAALFASAIPTVFTGAANAAVKYTAGQQLGNDSGAICKNTGKAVKDLQVAYIPPSSVYNYYLAIGAGVKKLVEGAGAKYYMIAPPKDDVSIQLGMIQDAVTRGANAIVMNTHDQQAATPVIKAASDAGVSIVIINSDIPNFPTPVQAVVGYKQRAGDKKVGQYAVKAAAGKPVKFGVIEGAPSYFTDERVGGWLAGVKGAKNFKKVASVNGEWSIDGGNKAGMDLLQANPDINVIFAANDYMAQGAAQAAKALGLKNIAIYGSDGDSNSGLEQIASGALKATLNTSPFSMGQIAGQVTLDCLTGKYSGGKFVETPGVVVDKKSVFGILCKPAQLVPAPNKKYSCKG